MSHTRTILPALLLLAAAGSSLAQDPPRPTVLSNRADAMMTEGGREFWVVFQKNFRDSVVDEKTKKQRPADSLKLALAITAGSDAHGYVEIPGLGKRTDFAVKGGEMVVVPVDPGAQVRSDGVIEKLGVHVVADTPIVVYGSDSR